MVGNHAFLRFGLSGLRGFVSHGVHFLTICQTDSSHTVSYTELTNPGPNPNPSLPLCLTFTRSPTPHPHPNPKPNLDPAILSSGLTGELYEDYCLTLTLTLIMNPNPEP